MLKIIDAFMYSGEADLLEIRLNTLSSVVDCFYIIESPKTHSLLDKPLYFLDQKSRFDSFSDKIVYINCDYCKYENAHYNDYSARNVLFNILPHGDCIILHSDLDEIINPDALSKCLENFNHPISFEVDYFMFCVDLFGRKDIAPFLIRKNWVSGDFYQYRNGRMKNQFSIINGSNGWHYSSVGTPEEISRKWNAFCHFNEIDNKFKEPEYIRKQIKRRAGSWNDSDPDGLLKIVEHKYPNLPKYLLENKEKFKHLFHESYL